MSYQIISTFFGGDGGIELVKGNTDGPKNNHEPESDFTVIPRALS
jgi:hypothetical protein